MKVCSLIALLLPAQLFAGEIVSDVPQRIDPETRYVFYLHGKIIEEGLRPSHPRWGLYDYPLILETLAQEGITVISEQRQKGTDARAYAEKVLRQVNKLIDGGAMPERITVIGFSAGGVIAILTSSMSDDIDINFVFMASCWARTKDQAPAGLHGRVLSVYETSDMALSCSDLADRKPGPASFEEIAIETGKEHGAFYLPDEAWVVPVLNFIQ